MIAVINNMDIIYSSNNRRVNDAVTGSLFTRVDPRYHVHVSAKVRPVVT